MPLRLTVLLALGVALSACKKEPVNAIPNPKEPDTSMEMPSKGIFTPSPTAEDILSGLSSDSLWKQLDAVESLQTSTEAAKIADRLVPFLDADPRVSSGVAIVLINLDGEPAAKAKEYRALRETLYGRVKLFGNRMAQYDDDKRRLNFYDIPPDMEVISHSRFNTDVRNFRDNQMGGADFAVFCRKDDLKEIGANPKSNTTYGSDTKLYTCKKNVLPKPTSMIQYEDWIVEKNAGYVVLDAPYILIGTEYRGAGEGGAQYPKKPFFGVLNMMDGKAAFELKVRSEPPNSVVTGLGIDTKGALFGLGQFVTFDNGCDGETSPRKIRKFYLWEAPDKYREIDTSKPTDEVSGLMKRFRVHETYMPWYKWPHEVTQEKIAAFRARLKAATPEKPLSEPVIKIFDEATSDIEFSNAIYELPDRQAFEKEAALAELSRHTKGNATEMAKVLEEMANPPTGHHVLQRRWGIFCATTALIESDEKYVALRSNTFADVRKDYCDGVTAR